MLYICIYVYEYKYQQKINTVPSYTETTVTLYNKMTFSLIVNICIYVDTYLYQHTKIDTVPSY